MEKEREKKSWREIDRGRDGSMHRREGNPSEKRREQLPAGAAREYRNALEALFSPKKEESAPTPLPKNAPRIVLPPNPDADPKTIERRRLLGKLLTATGPGPISKVADEFLAAGFVFPEDQETYLQLLEHVNEATVREAIEVLSRLLAGQVPKRKPVLEQRLRRIEEHAEDPVTREAAGALRRLVQGRPTAASARAR